MEISEKSCPYCAETIKAAAVKCRFCGERLDSASPRREPATSHQTKGTEASPQGTPEAGIGCLLCILAVGAFYLLPSFALPTLVLGGALLFAPAYLVFPFGFPTNPDTGEEEPRPIYPSEMRLVAWALALGLATYAVSGARRDWEKRSASAEPPPGATSAPVTRQATYRVTGTAASVGLTFANETGGMDQRDVSLPWSTTFVTHEGAFLYISAQNRGDKGDLKVEVVVDGDVLGSGQADSAYGVASASAKSSLDLKARPKNGTPTPADLPQHKVED